MSDMSVPTINEFYKKYSELDVSYDTLYYKELSKLSTGDKLILTMDSITSSYRNDLKELVIKKTFTPQEERKYFCNPQVLSYDLYGTTQFWHLLLELNEMSSATEFTRNPIKVYDGSLPTVINAIFALEEKMININNNDINEKTTDTITN